MPKEKREAQKAVMNTETSRQTTRYINGGNSYPVPRINRSWSTSFQKSGKNERHRERLAVKTIVVTTEDHCYEVPSIGATTRDELKLKQEVADTRVFLHATTGCRAVVITLEHTDVFVLSLAFEGFIPCPMFVLNVVNRLKQHTWMCQELLGCWVQNCADLSLVSIPSLAATVTLLFQERAR